MLFIDLLYPQGYDLDEHLKESQKNEIVAYSALLTNRLLPAIVSACIAGLIFKGGGEGAMSPVIGLPLSHPPPPTEKSFAPPSNPEIIHTLM